MTSILADYQYTLPDFIKISKSSEFAVDDNTINMVNKLATLVGAPTYQKTPVFKKQQIKKERPRRVKMTITASDWEEMRNFKTTELNKNEEGVEKQIDDIRSLLNKITSKNYNDLRDKIMDTLKTIINNNVSEEDLCKIGESIFEIGCMNKFWSKLYADLYKDLLAEYEIMNDILKKNFESFIDIFNNIRFVSAEEDYDEFCAVNKENSKRRAISSFFVHLMNVGVIETRKILNIINLLRSRFMEYIDIEGKKNEVDEISENLIILIKEGSDTIEDQKDLENEYEELMEFVSSTTKLKPSEHISFTNKTLFKFMDLDDECN